MPFKSQAQSRACFAKKDPKWDCEEWAHSTPGGIRSLPKRMEDGAVMQMNSRFGPTPPPKRKMPGRPGMPPPMAPLPPRQPGGGGAGGVAGGGHPSYTEMADGDAVGPKGDLGGGPRETDPPEGAGMGMNSSPIEDAQWPMLLDYTTDQERCHMCQYMGDDGNCPVVKTQVGPGDHCKAFQAKQQAEGSPAEEQGESPQMEAGEQEPEQ